MKFFKYRVEFSLPMLYKRRFLEFQFLSRAAWNFVSSAAYYKHFGNIIMPMAF